MERIESALHNFKELLPELVFEYVCATLANVIKDEGDPREWQSCLGPILRSCGMTDAQTSALFSCLSDTVLADYRFEEHFEQVVPFETPVQMLASDLMNSGTNSPANKVRLDWLSSRRVLSSRVDRARMEKLEARNRQRKEKRGLFPSSVSGASVEKQQSLDSAHKAGQQDLDQALLKELLENGCQSGAGEDVSKARDIKLEDFDISIVGKRILTNASLTIAYGRRYGLIGRNGIGKSTLLRYISSRSFSGIPNHLSILHVEQEIAGDECSVIASVLQSDRRRALLLEAEAQAEAAGDNERLLLIHRRLAEIGADDAESRAAVILSGLGFSPSDQVRPTRTFSGGWRMRVALARALFCQPDVLLLDEPTNMLDIPAVAWLEEYLQSWPSTLLVVSHDRFFLDAVATDILHLHSERIDTYRGNYTQFTVTFGERLKNAQREYENQLAYRQQLQSFIDRWRCSAARAAQAQSRLKILEKLPDLVPVVVDPPVVFKLFPCEPLSPPVVSMSSVTFSYSSNHGNTSTLLENIDFTIEPDAKLAIVGPNGAGKTTLLKLMLGLLEPVGGTIIRNSRLRTGYFSQHHVDQMNVRLTALEEMQQRFPEKTEEECRRALGAFGISGPLALQSISTLSGGQKSRVAFAVLAALHPHLLILDEPTNHLDMDSIDALIEVLKGFGGAVICVSHDKRFVDALCTQIWVCKERKICRFEGSIMDYCKSLIA